VPSMIRAMHGLIDGAALGLGDSPGGRVLGSLPGHLTHFMSEQRKLVKPSIAARGTASRQPGFPSLRHKTGSLSNRQE